MTALQQHLLDTYRTARLSRPAPPPPGRHDVTALRNLYRRLRPTTSGTPSSPPGTTSSPSGRTSSPSGV
ncbi:hypothetical protein ACIQU8_23345 [Streptomyces griseus]|uniref:hypothetical protein n=1 Tax=Streptomyces griseus TaxID=1911 RepID=UPI00382198F6